MVNNWPQKKKKPSPFPDPVIGPVITERYCNTCEVMKPIQKFPKGGDYCSDCSTTFPARFRNKIRVREELAHKMVAGLRGNEIKAPHISELCDVMVEEFGGLRKFGGFWKEQIECAANEKPGGKAVLDACKAIANLIEVSTQHRGSAPDMADLTDRDILAAMAQLAAESDLLTSDEDYEPDVLAMEDLGGE